MKMVPNVNEHTTKSTYPNHHFNHHNPDAITTYIQSMFHRLHQSQNLSSKDYEDILDLFQNAEKECQLSLIAQLIKRHPHHRNLVDPGQSSIQPISHPNSRENQDMHPTLISPLTFAFTVIIHYHHLYKAHQESNVHSNRPADLLKELDQAILLNKEDLNVDQIYKKLSVILFGSMSMTKQMIPAWSTICKWERYLEQSENPSHYLILGLNSYKLAKQSCKYHQSTQHIAIKPDDP
ncbi:hypothetical protein CLU79DRAFT_759305 [Phycomyces nitens]|nr:hypothetical protein CLU79DRAFT_759305 [Phycomyces nitens]